MTELIPQRPPFVLIDQFIMDGEAHSLFVVPKDHILVEDGRLSEAGLVENIAQTAAARAGYISRSEGKPVSLGYIGAVQKLTVHALPVAGAALRTTIDVKHQIFNATVVEGTVRAGDEVLASCEMKIFIV